MENLDAKEKQVRKTNRKNKKLYKKVRDDCSIKKKKQKIEKTV